MNNKKIEYGKAYQKKTPAEDGMPHEYLIPTKIEGISVFCNLFDREHGYRLCVSELLRKYKVMA